MIDFEVYYELGNYCGFSKVYYVDAQNNSFLVANKFGDFMWVSINNCKIKFHSKYEDNKEFLYLLNKEK